MRRHGWLPESEVLYSYLQQVSYQISSRGYATWGYHCQVMGWVGRGDVVTRLALELQIPKNPKCKQLKTGFLL